MKTKSKYIHQLPLEQLLPVNPGGHVGATVGIMLATVGAIPLADGDGVVGLIDDMWLADGDGVVEFIDGM